jgi:hypothetical protein
MSPPRKDPNVLDELLADGSMILFHKKAHELMTLNPTAAFVWECCDGTREPEAIAAELGAVFPASPDVNADVAAVLADLRNRGMLSEDG